MKSFEISRQLKTLPENKHKWYLTLYPESGFEMGLGRAGKYEGHSHLFFYDIIYSPDGIICADINNNLLQGQLIVVPPRTFLPEVKTHDFFFIKFCPDNKEVKFPEKIYERLSENKIESYKKSAKLDFSLYSSKSQSPKIIRLTLDNETLFLRINSNLNFKITR